MTSNLSAHEATGQDFTAGIAPDALPLVGHALRLAGNRMRFAESLASHGDLVEIRLGRRPVYVVCHPELARQVLLDDRTFDKGGIMYDKIRGIVGNGLASCPHDDHRRQRRLVQPAFQHARMPGYGSVMTDAIDRALGAWQAGQEADMLAEIQQITTDVSCRSLYALDVDRDTVTKLHEYLFTILKGVHHRLIVPEWLPTPGNRRFDQARAGLRATVTTIADSYRREGVDHGDLLSILLFSSGGILSDAEIYDQVVTFFVGADVTACVLSWAFYLVSEHPDVETRLHAEADAVLAGRNARFDDFEKLPFARSILAEALRLYPPIWLTTRGTTADIELAGKHIPAGSTIIYSSYIVHRRPGLYSDPARFDPDRPPGTRGSYIPFGSGPRKCIGEEFGTIEATLILASVASRWKLRTTDKARTHPAAAALLMPKYLHMRITERTGSPVRL